MPIPKLNSKHSSSTWLVPAIHLGLEVRTLNTKREVKTAAAILEGYTYRSAAVVQEKELKDRSNATSTPLRNQKAQNLGQLRFQSIQAKPSRNVTPSHFLNV